MQKRGSANTGEIEMNTNQKGLRVKSAIKAGGMAQNHSRVLKVRSAIKAGGMAQNHSRALCR
jgi:hypothetical protein